LATWDVRPATQAFETFPFVLPDPSPLNIGHQRTMQLHRGFGEEVCADRRATPFFVIPPPHNEVMGTTTTTIAPVDVSVSSDLATERLEHEICQLAADIASATARWLSLIAEYDRRSTYELWECQTMAQWLVMHTGLSIITARQYLQVARMLCVHPVLKEEFDAGRLPYSRVRTICRVITQETESDLVEQAKHMTSNQLERFVSALSRHQRAVSPDAADVDRAHCEDRSLNLWLNDDGSWTIRGVVPADVGTLLRRALDAQTARCAKPARHDAAASSSAPEPPSSAANLRVALEALRVDALVELVTAGHATLAASESDGRDVVDVRPLIVIHRYPDGDELESGPPIPSSIVEQYQCGADTMTAIHHRDTADDVSGHVVPDPCECEHPGAGIRYSGRRCTPTAALRRVLKERDQGCRWPGCGRRHRLHAHHIVEYSENGLTVSTNLIMLCSRHHPLLHRHGWTITGDPNGKVTFNRPGLMWPKLTDGSIERALDLANLPAGPFPPFRDGPLDLDLAVMALLHNASLKRPADPEVRAA
jgi:hypothetical protein